MIKTKKMSTEKIVLLSLFTALVAILAYLGGFIKVGSLASVALTLVPVVLGAALCGPFSGAWLGLVSGVVFFSTADAVFWLGLSIPGTLITVIVKGVAAGLAAGLVYKLLEGVNRYVAVVASAIVCPVVNTSLFLLGCRLFFMDAVRSTAEAKGLSVFGVIIVVFVGWNFVFEVLVNIVLAPAIVRILNVIKKQREK